MKEMSEKYSFLKKQLLKKIHIYFSVFMKTKMFNEIFMHQFELLVHKEQKTGQKICEHVWDEFFDFIFVSKIKNT